MASATLETFCCISTAVEPSILTKFQFNSKPYNIVCAISSILGTIGALYQIFPLPHAYSLSRYRNAAHRQKIIINWLALGDLFASIGILLRSVFWLSKGDIVAISDVRNSDMIMCSVLAIWIRYFYTTTYLWTLCYAIDVYLVSKQKTGVTAAYHIITWLVSGILTGVGLGTLYLPNFQCHTGPWRVLPNYLLSYIPIVFVMISNPILYYYASKQVRFLLSGCLGQLTYQEHAILAALKEKFFCIVLVFYVCWIPNVINGIILWGFWESMPQSTLIAVWHIMAVVNPLQAVLNSLVYKGWDDCKRFCCTMFCRVREETHSGMVILDASSTEYNFVSEAEQSILSTASRFND